MLVMITNRCNEGCPHCLEGSHPEGGMMDRYTLYKAAAFARYLGCKVVTVSGGEPTLHPNMFAYCKMLNDMKMSFSIVSNGTWSITDDREKIERQIRRMCADFKYFVAMQVYTNKLFYKDYDAIKAQKPYFDSFGGKVIFEESQIRSMQDLGRARTNELAQKMCDESPYHMSCLNATLAAKQIDNPSRYGREMEMRTMQFCHPMVDYLGNVHLSESWYCPSVGNVTKDLFDNIWWNIRLYQPCGQCKGYRKYRESTDPKIVAARAIIENS